MGDSAVHLSGHVDAAAARLMLDRALIDPAQSLGHQRGRVSRKNRRRPLATTFNATLFEREDCTLVAWYRSPYAPRAGGAYDSHHRTAGIAGRTWPHLAARRPPGRSRRARSRRT